MGGLHSTCKPPLLANTPLQLEAVEAEASEAAEVAEALAAELAELRQREAALNKDTQAMVAAANRTQAQVGLRLERPCLVWSMHSVSSLHILHPV